MINFVVLTDTPVRFINFLETRGIIKRVADPDTGERYVGVRPGVELVSVNNPIVTNQGSGTRGQPGYVPPTMDDRSVFMVKFTEDAEVEQAENFKQWLLANTSVVTAPANYTLGFGGEPIGDARKVNGELVWLVHDRPERFGAWQ